MSSSPCGRARAESVWLKAQDKQVSGELMEAEVREQNKGGLIVNIMGLRGFLPTSQVSRSYSANLQELVNQHIGVKILEVNRKRNRLIVSQKAAFDEDRARQRTELFDRLKVGDDVRGKVSGLTSYGAFVNLGAADGLIHISELSWDRVANVGDVLQVGQDIDVRVIKLDPETSRISLSLRQLGQDPWDHIEKRYPPGAIIEGEVTKDQEIRGLPPDRRRDRGPAAYLGARLGACRAHRRRRPGGPEAPRPGPPGRSEPAGGSASP